MHPYASNPFVEIEPTYDSSNPFATTSSTKSSPRHTQSKNERDVELILAGQPQTSPATQPAPAFGSPINATSSFATSINNSAAASTPGTASSGVTSIGPMDGGGRGWNRAPTTKQTVGAVNNGGGAWTNVQTFEISTPPHVSKSKSSSTFSSPSAATNRDAQLTAREQELRRREADVSRREAALRQGLGIKTNNWPRCFPLLHHDIDEVPYDRRSLVKWHYITWMVIAAAYLWNFICITVFWIGGEKGVDLWIMSALVAFGGLPLSFLCWYRQVYFAAIKDSGARWGWYFLNMLANIVWCWWVFVGMRPKIGGYSAGLFTMIQQFARGGGEGTPFGVLCVLNMVLFGVGDAASIVLMGRSYKEFRGKRLVR